MGQAAVSLGEQHGASSCFIEGTSRGKKLFHWGSSMGQEAVSLREQHGERSCFIEGTARGKKLFH